MGSGPGNFVVLTTPIRLPSNCHPAPTVVLATPMTGPQLPWFLYLIRCSDNSLYTGITLDLERRFAEHEEQGKKCAKYLKGKAPLELVFSSPAGQTKSQASRLEFHVKRLAKKQKERLVTGQLTMGQLGLGSQE
jgi:putative endonuclease